MYRREGIEALTFDSLKQKKLYFPLYSKGLKLVDVVRALGLEGEYQRHRESQPIRPGGRETLRWTWDRITATARDIAEREGNLPAAAWFQANGHGSVVAAVYSLGKTWADLRAELKDYSNSNFVESRNGLRWLSHAEASLSNFLFSRGIEHRKGGTYGDGYAEQSGHRYGKYDVTFLAGDGRWIDVEVWGDKPLGREEEYRAKRVVKEVFNRDHNPNFLGIAHQDCYNEKTLTRILECFIGTIEPFRFVRPADPLIQTTHWSNADELLDCARHLAASMPDGKFPTEEWLRKRGKWAHRPGDAYNTLSVYIKLWLGGVRNLRKLLDQEHHSTVEWTQEKAIDAYSNFHDRYGMTPAAARARYLRHADLDRDIYLEASRVEAAVAKYAEGGKAVRESLGIERQVVRKWTKEKVLNEAKVIIDRYGLSPTQLLADHHAGHIVLPDDVKRQVGRLVDAANRLCGGMAAVVAELGFTRPTRYRAR